MELSRARLQGNRSATLRRRDVRLVSARKVSNPPEPKRCRLVAASVAAMALVSRLTNSTTAWERAVSGGGNLSHLARRRRRQLAPASHRGLCWVCPLPFDYDDTPTLNYAFFDLDLFKVTAARTRAFNGSSSIFPPSWKSMARLTFPSRLELKRPEGSFRAAPLAKVILTTFL